METATPHFADEFDAERLDGAVWLPHYLPAWSSRADSAATYTVENSCLTLSIPPGQGLWCEGDHEPPLRVSGLQSGGFSGPVGSTRGQQRFRDGQVVREEQPRFEGWLPATGSVAIRCAMSLSPRSMAALWLSGLEVRRCADPPTYPMQVMVAVFDFPEWSTGDNDRLVPALTVDWIRGSTAA